MTPGTRVITGRQEARPATRLLLASRSPRRHELLASHGIEHDAEHPGVDDADLIAGAVKPAEWVAALAYFKAAAALDRLRRGNVPVDRLVLGADTICLKDGHLIGQARDSADAERILRLLSDGSHEVLTGVALLGPRDGTRELFVDRARVHVGALGDGLIRPYIASGVWRGKAGAYNLRERIEAGWPIRYEGDPTTIMGLPMRRLLHRLARLGHFPGSAGGAA